MHGKRAPEYRREAEACFEVAQRISAKADRDRLFETSSQWVKLAEIPEAKADRRILAAGAIGPRKTPPKHHDGDDQHDASHVSPSHLGNPPTQQNRPMIAVAADLSFR
jgi:hypothetical protein